MPPGPAQPRDPQPPPPATPPDAPPGAPPGAPARSFAPSPAPRFLAIDLGDARTGLAVGDALTRLALPAGVLEIPLARRDGADLLDALAHAIRQHRPAALVLGLPLNMDGTEGPRARLVRAFAQRLRAAAALPVHLADERLTTAQADWQMARSGLSRQQKKARRDALAAANLLRGFLESARPDQAPQPPIDP